jgi:hypothetical protein
VRHPPHRQGALVAALLAAFLSGSAAVADSAAAATARDKDARPVKTAHAPREGKAGHEAAKPKPKETKEPKEQKAKAHRTQPHARHAARSATGPSAVTVAPPPAAPRAAALRLDPPAATPFQRTARPVRPLTRPVAVVRRSGPLWQVHEQLDRPGLIPAVRTVTGDPTTALLLAGLVGVFLLVQHRIDRNDPKLSRGHREDPPDLRFGPARRVETAL